LSALVQLTEVYSETCYVAAAHTYNKSTLFGISSRRCITLLLCQVVAAIKCKVPSLYFAMFPTYFTHVARFLMHTKISTHWQSSQYFRIFVTSCFEIYTKQSAHGRWGSAGRDANWEEML